VLGGIEQLAATCGGDPSLVPRLRDRLDHVHEFVIGRRRTRMVFLEWLDPPYPAGHWTPDLIRLAGGEDPLARPGRPSVPITWSEVRAAKPQALVIAPCGYSRPRAEAEARRCRDVPWTELDGRVCVLDGSAYFNRPGPRVVDSVEILAGFLHGYNPGS
jgi:iron complex transport system substrate-binding protein